MTSEGSSKKLVEIELSAESLPHAIRELLGHWRDEVQAQWAGAGMLPAHRLVQLHVVAHAAAVGGFLEDDVLLERLHKAAESYFNDLRLTGGGRQDDTWFYTRARAVDYLLDEIEGHASLAQANGRLTLDDLAVLQDVATEMVDLVVGHLSRIELALEILAALPSEFRDAQHRAAAIGNATSSIVSKLGVGEPVGSIAVLESIMRGLGHASATNLTSVARKSRRTK